MGEADFQNGGDLFQFKEAFFMSRSSLLGWLGLHVSISMVLLRAVCVKSVSANISPSSPKIIW